MENSRKVVLVVDDEVGMREMLTWLLGKDYDIVAACDGAEAVARIAAGGVDLVVTDITMPHLGGFGVLEAAASTLPKTPTIVMTGFGTVEMAVQAMRQGASDFLLKPFDAEVLADRIQETLANRPNRLTTA
jgi:DNA-binding NtrC family response regulator